MKFYILGLRAIVCLLESRIQQECVLSDMQSCHMRKNAHLFPSTRKLGSRGLLWSSVSIPPKSYSETLPLRRCLGHEGRSLRNGVSALPLHHGSKQKVPLAKEWALTSQWINLLAPCSWTHPSKTLRNNFLFANHQANGIPLAQHKWTQGGGGAVHSHEPSTKQEGQGQPPLPHPLALKFLCVLH